jgi:hypothetical protein
MNPSELHVLLIGIDAYDGGGSLRGCVNDVDAIQAILLDRLKVPAERVTRLVSPRSAADQDTRIEGSLPTLAAITGELDRLASDQVKPTERVFIYYSGHGTQLILEDDEGRRFPREAILPKDKVRGPDTIVLPDWELNAAIARIGARCHSATIVLDCCCSAGATRALDLDTGTTRFWPSPDVQRITQADNGFQTTTRGVSDGLAGIENCQVVAACEADQKAKEADFDGRMMGHLSRSLCELLEARELGDLPRLRWGQIWRQVEAAVVDRNPEQRPWLSTGFARTVFGGDTDDNGDTGFAVVQHGDRYELDVGSLAGVTTGARLAIYGPDPVTFPALGSAADQAARKGTVLVESAARAACTATPEAPFALPEAARGRLVAPGVDAKLAVVLVSPDAAADNDVAAALRESPFVELVSDTREADLELHRLSAGWALADDLHGPGPSDPHFPLVPHGRPDLLREVVELYYRYRAPLRMANACRDLPTLLRLALLRCDQHQLPEATAQTVTLPEVPGSDRARYDIAEGALICIAVENRSDRGLYVTLLDAAASGRVLRLGTSQIPARGRQRFWFNNQIGTPFGVSLPPGQSLGVDRFVAIGTTVAGVDLGHLQQVTSFADHIEKPRESKQPRDVGAPPEPPPVEQYTSAVAAMWVRR